MKKICLVLFIFGITVLSAVSSFGQYSVKVVSPNGGEKFQVGTEVEIKWEGIQPYQEVSLDYSTNGGAIWKNIYGYATGLSYKWKVPNDASTQCLIRAIVVDPISPAQWIRTATGADKDDFTSIVVTDRKGNIYACGTFGAPVIDFGTGKLSNLDSTQGIFLTKYDPTGNIVWIKTITGKIMNNWPSSIVIDSSDNLYMRGNFGSASLDFGNGVTLTKEQYKTSSDWLGFLAKFDADGRAFWAKPLIYSGGNENTLAVDTTGSLYACGGFVSDTLDFGNEVILTDSHLTAEVVNPSNGYVVKMDFTGKAVWARKIGCATGGSSEGIGVSVVTSNGAGRVTIGGGFSREYADFGDGILLTNSNTRSDCFVAQYDDKGKILWAKSIKSTVLHKMPDLQSMVQDHLGNTYVCGYFEIPTMDFGNGIVLKSIGSIDGFIAKYDKLGNVLWAKLIEGEDADYITSVAIDKLGEIYIAGSSGSYELKFGNNVIMKTINSNYTDYFIAKFNKDGIAQWYKRAVGNSLDMALVLTVDPAKNIILGGATFSTELNFGTGDILQRTKNSEADLFVAKYSSDAPFGVSDISDNTWTIDKPEFSALNIDMGKVLLGTQKDSVITAFIRNEGGWPVDVRDIQLSGAQASEFQILTGKPPFIIPVNEVAAVQFRFTPAATGIRQANLTVVTPIDNLYQNIQGEGVQPLINIAASLVDMGIVEIGSQKDTMLTAIVENIGTAPLTITSTTLSGAGKDAYTLINSPGSFIMEAGSKQNIELRFSPHSIGQMNAELQFEYEGMTSGPAIARITGIGIGGSMSVENDSAYAGESRFLKIKLNKHTAHDLQHQRPVGFKASLSYGNSIIAPAMNTAGVMVANNNETGTVEIASEWNGTSTELAAIPFTATLGDRTETPLELLSFHWLNDAGEIINSDTELQNGIFTMLGICGEGGMRLYDANGKAQMMMLAPHPASGIVQITFEIIERGATKLMLTDVLGQQIVLKEGSFEKGNHSFAFDAGGLAGGMYILTMQTPTQVFTQQVIVGK